MYHYPVFERGVDDLRLRDDLQHDLNRVTGLEAVTRVRCSRGLRVTNFYGNFLVRGTDLLALPCITEDTAFNVELEHDGVHALTEGSLVAFQAVVLYTSLTGQRRIVVHTLAMPVTTVLADLFQQVGGCSKCWLFRALLAWLTVCRLYLF